MISRRDIERPFIFIRVPKTASTSISYALRHYKNEDIELNNGKDTQANISISKHFTYFDASIYLATQFFNNEPSFCCECGQLQADSIKNYFTFAVVRNPYERIVSYWKGIYNDQSKRGSIKNHVKKFKNYVASLNNKPKPECGEVNLSGKYNFKMNQLQYLTHNARPNGEIQTDFIIRYENLTAQLKEVEDILGITIQSPLERYAHNKHKHYSTYYDKQSRKLVSKIFKYDIEYFGYEFEAL